MHEKQTTRRLTTVLAVLLAALAIVAWLQMRRAPAQRPAEDEQEGPQEATEKIRTPPKLALPAPPRPAPPPRDAAPPVRAVRRSFVIAVTVDGNPAPDWTPERLATVHRYDKQKDVRDLVRALLENKNVTVEIAGKNTTGEPETITADLTALDEHDQLLIYPDYSGTYSVLRNHLYRTDDNQEAWIEMQHLEGVSALRFTNK